VPYAGSRVTTRISHKVEVERSPLVSCELDGSPPLDRLASIGSAIWVAHAGHAPPTRSHYRRQLPHGVWDESLIPIRAAWIRVTTACCSFAPGCCHACACTSPRHDTTSFGYAEALSTKQAALGTPCIRTNLCGCVCVIWSHWTSMRINPNDIGIESARRGLVVSPRGFVWRR
jgi:hypothetical protein